MSLAAALGIERPVDIAPNATEEERVAYNEAVAQFEKQVEEGINLCIQEQVVPPGVTGLIPDGDLTMLWRWTGPVYEDSTQDVLNNSIVVRNLQELGVDSIEALKYLFPSKTDEERAEMLSGFPFRMVSELQGAFAQFSRLVGGLMQTPHPQSPNLPMAADPRLDLTPYLYRTLEALQKEMSYAGRYRPIDPTDEPDSGSSAEQLRDSVLPAEPSPGLVPGSSGELPGGSTSGGPGLPTLSPYSVRPPIPTGDTGESMGVGVQQGGEPAERTSSIPIPGSTISSDDELRPGQLRFGGQPSYATIGSADLVNQPGLLAQLFPNLFGQQPEPGKPTGTRSVRKRSSRNSK
jgi:hypothetical protein